MAFFSDAYSSIIRDKSELVDKNLTWNGQQAQYKPQNLLCFVVVWYGYLTHCGLVMPYGIRDLGQHWFR